MDPGRVIDEIVTEVALQGSYGATLEKVWSFASSRIPNLTPQLKVAVWRSLIRHKSIILSDAGEPVTEPYSDFETLINAGTSLHFHAREDVQWLTLTGFPKQGNPVGPFPFRLLCAASIAREKGLTSVELHQETGQDSRSLHGRIAKLVSLGLVERFPVIQDMAHTNRIILTRYLRNRDNSKSAISPSNGIDKVQLSTKLVSFCKEGPGQRRLQEELVTLLDLDKVPHGSKTLRKFIQQLEVSGFVQRVDVYDPEEPDIRYRCVQFLRDYVFSDDRAQLEDETEEEDEPSSEIKPKKVSLESMMVATDPNLLRVNILFPLAHQIVSLVFEAGTVGLEAITLYNNLTGLPFKKNLARTLDQLVAIDSKTKKELSYFVPESCKHLELVRGMDFESRIKFYRYYTQATYATYNGTLLGDQWGELSSSAFKARELKSVNSHYATPLLGISSVARSRLGLEIPIFHGDKPDPSVVTVRQCETHSEKRRGRPPKNATPTSTSGSGPSKVKLSTQGSGRKTWVGGRDIHAPLFPTYSFSEAKVALANQRPSNHHTKENLASDSTSFAVKRREDLILGMIEQMGGVMEGGASLSRLLDTNNSSTIDRKTIDRCVEGLISNGKLCQILVSAPSARGVIKTKSILHSPRISTYDHCVLELKKKLEESIFKPRVPPPQTASPNIAVNAVTDMFSLLQNVSKPRRFLVINDDNTNPAPKTKKRFGPSASVITGDTISGSEQRRPSKIRTDTSNRGHTATNTTLLGTPKKFRKIGDGVTLPVLSIVDEDRLFRAIVISRSLYGRGFGIDWEMVCPIVQGLSPIRARRSWPSIRERFGGSKGINQATTSWDSLFLAAYERGEIGVLNPDAPGFLLSIYVDFWVQRAPSITSQPLMLQTDVSSISCRSSRPMAVSNPLDAVFNSPSMVKMEEHLTSVPFGDFCEVFVPYAIQFSEHESVIRSLVADDDETYSESDSTAQVSSIGEDLVKRGTDFLVSQKIISYTLRDNSKILPDRNFTLSERVHGLINTRHGRRTLENGSQFANELDRGVFTRMPASIEEHMMIAALELAAAGRLIFEQVNLSTGRLIADYRSRFISKEKLDFEIGIVPLRTSAKSDNIDLPTPLSCDTFPYIWQRPGHTSSIFYRMVARVLGLIVTRPYSPSEHIIHALGKVFSAREIEAVVEWLLKSGLISNSDGLTPRSNWFRIPWSVESR